MYRMKQNNANEECRVPFLLELCQWQGYDVASFLSLTSAVASGLELAIGDVHKVPQYSSGETMPIVLKLYIY